MDWRFQNSEWSAESADGLHLWRITVTEHGHFDVSESDRELTDEVGVFHTLGRAKVWCETVERNRYISEPLVGTARVKS